MKIKVYCLNDYDWWAGRSIKEVKEDYLQMTGLPEDEAFDGFYILSKGEMGILKFKDEDGKERTFKEQLDIMIEGEVTFPWCFACTDC